MVKRNILPSVEIESEDEGVEEDEEEEYKRGFAPLIGHPRINEKAS